jgi:hypothetical protein
MRYASRMFLVAVAELSGALELPQIKSLAAEIGTSAYELRLLLNAGLPAVVLATTDEVHARSVLAAITRNGHLAVACDRRAVVLSASMVLLRDFEIDRQGLVADRASQQRCPSDDIAALLRATHRTSTESVQQVKERKIRPVMALATGGLILSKTTSKQVTSTTVEREQVLYIFRRSGGAPWLLRGRMARYGGLGAAMGPSSFENFAATIARLRELSPNASYDERLVTSRPIRGVADGIEATDLYAHLLAEYLGRPRTSPST